MRLLAGNYSNVIAKDKVLKQSQSRLSNFKKRLLRPARNDGSRVFQSSLKELVAILYPKNDKNVQFEYSI